VKPYEKLAEVYQLHWGEFSPRYVKLIDFLETGYDFSPQSLLDISCGTGDLLSALKDRDISLTGSDLSEKMIEVARESNPNLDFKIGDMKEIKFARQFDVIVSAFNSVNYLLELEELRQAFKNIKSNLKENGFFIFDISTKFLYEEEHSGVIERELTGINFEQRLDYQEEEKLAYTTFDFGVGLEETHIQRPYEKEEVKELLNQLDFEVLHIFRNVKLEPPQGKDRRLYFIVRNN